MNRYITTVLLFLASVSSYAQTSLRPEYDLNMLADIRLESGICGSGFFVTDHDKQWLVTARHIFFGVPGTGKVQSATAQIYTVTQYGLERRLEFTVNLERAFVLGRLLKHKEHDIAICLVATNNHAHQRIFPDEYIKYTNSPEATFSAVKSEDFMRLDRVDRASQVYMLGFPSSVDTKTQIDPVRPPLLGTGIVGGKYRTIMLDDATYPGTSGGLVWQYDDKRKGHNILILGVVSKFMPDYRGLALTREGCSEMRSNSGIVVVEPSDFILELIEMYKTQTVSQTQNEKTDCGR